MLFAHSETIPAFWRMLFSRSVSSQTIRIRAPSGTFNVKLERVLLSPVISSSPTSFILCVPVRGLTHIFHHCSPRQFPSLGRLFGSSGSQSSRALDMSWLGEDSHIAHSQETSRGLRGYLGDFQGIEFLQL